MRGAGVPSDMETRIAGHAKDIHGKYGKGAGLVAMAAAMASVDPLNG